MKITRDEFALFFFKCIKISFEGGKCVLSTNNWLFKCNFYFVYMISFFPVFDVIGYFKVFLSLNII